MEIKWFEPYFGEKEKKAVIEVLEKGYVNEGPKTKELEEKLQEFLNVEHIILTTSGTSALFLALKTDQIIRKLKDYEIIIPDFTCIATASSVKLAGATPILADIENQRHCINTEEIKKKITPKTKAIIPVQILGRSCEMEKLKELAEEHNLILIEDAAGALSSKTNQGYLGTLGKLGCFSLQSNKIISCGQGGIIATNDSEYNKTLRRIKDHGRLDKKEVVYPIEGYNFKFNDILASIALKQLEEIEKRKRLLINQRMQYERELNKINEIFIPKINYNFGEFGLWIDLVTEDSRELFEYLKKNNIITRKPGWPPIHRNGAYTYLGSDENFPVSTYVSDNSLWLPNGPTINSEQIDYICNKIKEFYENKQIL